MGNLMEDVNERDIRQKLVVIVFQKFYKKNGYCSPTYFEKKRIFSLEIKIIRHGF